MTLDEHRARLSFAKNQFELYELRVKQAQSKAAFFLLLNDLESARKELSKADNFIQFLNECNETIDEHFRATLTQL